MNKRTCTMPGCAKPHRARGLCSTHYNQAHQPDRHRDSAAQSKARRARDKLDPAKVAKERDRQMRKNWWGLATITNGLPRQIDAEMDDLESRLRLTTCAHCDSVVLTSKVAQVFCSTACKRRAQAARRRAAERGASGDHFRSDVLRVWREIGRVCCYCDEPTPSHEVQADHFTSLARGGTNDIGNIVPACGGCNADKRELSIPQWNADRARRGLPARALSPKITHLTSLALV